MTEQILIYQGRLKMKKAGLIRFLDDNNMGQSDIPPGIPVDYRIDRYDDGEKDGQMPKFGFEDSIKIYTFWNSDIQYTHGQTTTYGLTQFNVGHIELKPATNGGDGFTDVSIVSEWPVMRPLGFKW